MAIISTGTGIGGSWAIWTPVFSGGINVIGTATLQAYYTQIGKLVVCRIRIVMGASTTYSASNMTFTLPVTANTATAPAGNYPSGSVYIEDAGVAAYLGDLQVNSATTGQLLVRGSAGSYTTFGNATNLIPFTWGSGDFFQGHFYYEAA